MRRWLWAVVAVWAAASGQLAASPADTVTAAVGNIATAVGNIIPNSSIVSVGPIRADGSATVFVSLPAGSAGGQPRDGCAPGCVCGAAAGEEEYQCRGGSGAAYLIKARTNDYVRIICQEGSLQCTDIPLIPLSSGYLPSLGMTGCAIPPLACLLLRLGVSSLGALTINDGRDPLGVEHVRGLSNLTMLSMYDAAAQSSIPYEALSAVPSLREFRLHGGTLSLRPLPPPQPPHPGLRYVELISDKIGSVPAGSLSYFSGVATLVLWNNNIRNLSADAFDGLSNVQELELSRNPLRELPPGLLAHTPRLARLKVVGGHLSHVHTDALTGMTHLQEVLIKMNHKRLTFGPRALASLPALTKLTIDGGSIAALPPDLLRGDLALKRLQLTNTDLDSLPPDIFQGLASLEELNLKGNRLKTLPDAVLWPLRALVSLNLDGNHLERLQSKLFSGLKSLVTLSADDNRIASIAADAFQGPVSLESLSLANNRLTLSPEGPPTQYLEGDQQSPFRSLFKLQKLVLRNNMISQMMADWRLVLVLNLKTLDLSGNNFTEITKADVQFLSNDIVVDLRHNHITTVDVLDPPHWFPPDTLANHTDGVILLDHNPFHCNCELYAFVKRLKGARPLTTEPVLDPGSARCHTPPALSGTLIRDLRVADLVCALPPHDCPSNCSCTVTPALLSLDVDCERETSYPKPEDFGLRHMRLRLRTPPTSRVPDTVVALNLSGVGLGQLPALVGGNVEVLDLSRNSLAAIPRVLESNLSVYLRGNPFVCDCDHRADVSYLQRHYLRVLDYRNVSCGGGLVWRVDSARLCDVRRASVVGGAIAALGVAAVVVSAVLYRYRLEVKVFLYSRGWCLALVREDEERDAKYDAFVSFSQQDAQWVVEQLVPKLEVEHGLRLCLHYRDWHVGEMIPDQIVRSVSESRRTIMVLSEHYLRSVWAPLEFRAAHARAQRERRTRLLVVVLRDIPAAAAMDDQLRAYITTNTYLKWGDPRFWERLLYSLPHNRTFYPKTIKRGDLEVRLTDGKTTKEDPPFEGRKD